MKRFSVTAFFCLGLVLIVGEAEAHIRITPVGRMGTSDAVKFIQRNRLNPALAPDSPGPCANFTTRMTTPLQLNAGQQFSFVIQETINHPGRFYVQYSPANDSNFWLAANQLALVQDTQNNGTTTVTFTVPNVSTTNTATIRVLQEMDEQPGEYYVHCVDVNILNNSSTTPSPVPTPPIVGSGAEGKSSAPYENEKPTFNTSCGVISAIHENRKGGGPPSAGSLAVIAFLFLLPITLGFYLRARVR
ncbi:MAG: hypothetical protein IPM97_11200 [Bdellovibrionaceae bacterium]|nr:hypothetical protein [Pseudobdellovibrionaceae bacterium]